MNRAYMIAFAAATIAIASMALSCCTSTGGLAGAGKPVDTAATVATSCNFVKTADFSFQTYAKQHPGVIDANGMNTEGGVIAPIFTRNPDGTLTAVATGFCGGGPINIGVAESTLIAAAFQVATLLTTWQH